MTTDEMVALAESIARTYHRRCPLATYEDQTREAQWTSFDDMVQEALAAMLRAHRTYMRSWRESRPWIQGDERGYLYKAGVYAIHALMHRSISPVSATSHTLGELRGLVRVPVDWLMTSTVRPVRSEGGADVAMRQAPVAATSEAADEALADRSWLKRVRERVHAVLDPLPHSTLAREVLLGYLTPQETARESGVPVKTVYAAVRRAKLAIENDRVLYDLTRERIRD